MTFTIAVALFAAAFIGGSIMTAQLAASPEQDASAPYVLEVTLDHSASAVWDAITQKSLIDKYYFVPVSADMSRAGAAFYYGPAGQKLITGVVTAVEPTRLLQHSFRFAEEADTANSVVTYTLTPDGKGTRLRIEHGRYALDSQGYADISGGWPVIVERMKTVLARHR
jgi:uncharacterized protein YndB with AHSA1/START domain